MLTKKYSVIESAKCYLRFSIGKGLVKCVCCLYDFPPRVIELGHYDAKSNGGKNSDFVALCSACNRRQMNVNAEQFFNDATLAKLALTLKTVFSENEIFTALIELVECEKEYISNCTANLTISEATKRLIAQKQFKSFVG